MSKAEDASRDVQANAGTSGDGGGMQARLRKLDELADKIDKARSASRTIRLLVILLLLLVVGGVGLRVYSFYGNIQNNAPKYQSAFAVEMGKFATKAVRHLQDVAQSSVPHFTDALHKDWQKNGDEVLKTVDKHGQLLVENASKNLKVSMSKELADLVKHYDAQLAEAFPELKDPKSRDRVIDSIRHAITIATVNLVEKNMTETIALMGEIHDETVKFLPEKKDQDRMIKTTGQLFRAIEVGVLREETKKKKATK